MLFSPFSEFTIQSFRELFEAQSALNDTQMKYSFSFVLLGETSYIYIYI